MLFRFPHSSWLPACRRLLLLLPALVLAAGLSARSLVKADVQLANNAVLAMYQDEDANMWIGTYDGLHLYNGKNTFVFRMELDNEFSLCSNIVLEIAPAEKGYLWVATSLGINKFSCASDASSKAICSTSTWRISLRTARKHRAFLG